MSYKRIFQVGRRILFDSDHLFFVECISVTKAGCMKFHVITGFCTTAESSMDYFWNTGVVWNRLLVSLSSHPLVKKLVYK